ncbi:poly [ADP-ribose] polymerase tankyrase-2-like [Neocloeon triangulifer]|uniref:poly [ADP-ribose] polymerase tankyrase-2-like n=1 Tax=Neocloeon triangulifer TaxID=2078957 RepID=UPI00286F2DD6|nr:poly [ADP-ribose] polymerase tankyrase-2-like [Neocloeon triangulifer]
MAELVELQPGDEMYEKIFKLTVRPRQKIYIEKIYAIINPTSLSIYEVGKFIIEEEIGGESKVFDLFHGSAEGARKIVHEGFNLNFSKDSGIFGKGFYFAANPYDAIRYGLPRSAESDTLECTSQILLCRCVVGRIFETPEQPGCIPKGFHSAFWFTDDCDCFSYCFPKSEQILPYALIECKLYYED